MMTSFLSVEILRRLFSVVCLLALAAILTYSTQHRSRIARRLLYCGFALFLLVCGGVFWVHIQRMPRGLAAQYYENPFWKADSASELDRYFEADGSGRRVDRFIDFDANDFNLHTFGGKPFSAEWQGYLYIPEDGYQVNLRSNIDSRLLVENKLFGRTLEGAENVDLGKADARKFLTKGWSFNERSSGENPVDYVWAANDDTQLLLAVVEPAAYELSIRCSPFSYPGSQPQEMEIWVEDTLLQRIQLQSGWQNYRIELPKNLIEQVVPGTLPVKFAFSRLTKVSDVSDSSDDRKLAVAFDRVGLRAKGGSAQNASAVVSHKFSKGVYQLNVKARTFQNKHSFLQLVWKAGEGKAEQVIPEDFLFVDVGEMEEFLHGFQLERTLLLGLSCAIGLNILLFAGWLLSCVILPNRRKWLTREVLVVALLCLFAFAVRAAFILERSSFDPGFHLITPGTDQANYVAFARGLFRGYWPGLTHAPFHFNVLNAFYLALNFVLFGEDLLASRLMTAALSTLTILFTYFIARRLFGRPIAYITVLLCACNGILIFYDTSLLISPLKAFLCMGSLWMLLKLEDELSWRTIVGAGVFLGLNALARATILLFMPFVMLWLLWRVPAGFVRKCVCGVVLCLVMFLTISPVTLRNYFSNERHPLVLITSGDFGFNWWAANNPSATGIFGYSPTLFHDVNQKVQQKKTTYNREVLDYIKTSPLEYLHLEYTKLRYFWRGYEPANLLPYYVFREQSKILGLPWINFVLLGPFSLIGLGLAWRTWRQSALLYAFVGMQIGLLLLFWVLARYRIVVVPILSIFAAYTLWFLVQTARQKQWLRVGVTLGLCIVLYFALNYPDAARYYEQHHHEVMPFVRSLRYWDIFHTW